MSSETSLTTQFYNLNLLRQLRVHLPHMLVSSAVKVYTQNFYNTVQKQAGWHRSKHISTDLMPWVKTLHTRFCQFFCNKTVYFTCAHASTSATYEKRSLGSFLVGMQVTTCPQRSTPLPNRIHQSQSSRVRASVENARPPNWTITICTRGEKCVTLCTRQFGLWCCDNKQGHFSFLQELKRGKQRAEEP